MFDRFPNKLPTWLEEFGSEHGLSKHAKHILYIREQYDMEKVEDSSLLNSLFESMLRKILGNPTLKTGPLYRNPYYRVSLLEYKRDDAGLHYPFVIIRENLTDDEKEAIKDNKINFQKRGFIKAMPTEGETTTATFLCYSKEDDEKNIYAIELPLGSAFQ